MDSSQISALLESSEGVTLEFKKSLHFAEPVARTLCAFANTLGGQIIVGVEKQGNKTAVTGVRDTDAEYQKLAQIAALLRPKPYYETHEFKQGKYALLIISIQPMPTSEVCFYQKTIYRRIGSINDEVSGPNVVRFLQQKGALSFEDNRAAAALGDLSLEKIKTLLEKRGVKVKDHEPLVLASLLGSLGVANAVGESFLKNSAVLFFAKDVRKFFMNSEVRIVKYRGKAKSLETRETDQRFSDTLSELLAQTLQAVQEKAGTFAKIVDGRRTESPMIPEEVMREALTNAVGHRDYFDPNGILVEIFDDRIEITNPGSLLPGLTLKNFSEVRKARNPLTYRLLNDSQWGEGLNLGIKAMYRIMRQSNLPDPEFEDLAGMFKVTLYGPLSDKKPRPYGKITERQVKAIEHLKKHATFTAPQFAKIAGISHPTAIRDLNDLVAQGVLVRTGRYRSSKYALENINK